MFRLTALLPLFAFSLQAGAVCIWTVQSRDTYFTKDPLFQEGPKIERTACKADQPPICSGYVYCPVVGMHMAATGVACKSIKVDDKWRCPDAQTCYDDPDIKIFPTKIPAAGTQPAAETPAATTTN